MSSFESRVFIIFGLRLELKRKLHFLNLFFVASNVTVLKETGLTTAVYLTHSRQMHTD